MIDCCCSSPYCVANGCQAARRQTPGVGIPAPGGWPFIAQDLAKWALTSPLTADEVRRIVREELARDLGERPS